MTKFAPVAYQASSVARKVMNGAMSSGVPSLFSGTRFTAVASRPAGSGWLSWSGVRSSAPGQMLLAPNALIAVVNSYMASQIDQPRLAG